MATYIISDRKHVRIAIYNLLGISPDPETGTRVVPKITAPDIERASSEDLFVGNIPLEILARLQEKGCRCLVFEADGLDGVVGGTVEAQTTILDAVDKTGRLVAYDVQRHPDQQLPEGGVFVHANTSDTRAALFSCLQEKGVPHAHGKWGPAGRVNRIIVASGKGVAGCGTLPRHASLYSEAGVPFFLLETDLGDQLVAYTVRRVEVVHAPRGKRAFEQ